MKNYYLLYTEASKGEERDEEDINYVRRLTRDARDIAKKVLGEKGGIDVDCYGDTYERVPIVDYADRQYDYRGLSEESLRAYSKGYNFPDVGSAVGGAVLLVAEEISLEEIAEKLVHEPRTYTLRIIKRVQ